MPGDPPAPSSQIIVLTILWTLWFEATLAAAIWTVIRDLNARVGGLSGCSVWQWVFSIPKFLFIFIVGGILLAGIGWVVYAVVRMLIVMIKT